MLRLKKLTPILAVCLVLALCSVLTAANTFGVSKIGGNRGLQVGLGGLQLTTHADDPTDERLANGRLYYQTSVGLRAYVEGSWVTIGATTADADTVYDTGTNWTVTADTHDCLFNYAAAYNTKLNATVTGSACVLETDNATGTATTSILCSATSTVTNAIDASAANITNALSFGANILLGTEVSIGGTTGSITINDTGDAGAFTVEGTVLDINSLDFVGAGAITAAASSAITIDPNSGDAAGEDLIITAHNVQLTATGAVTMSPDAAVTTAFTITDTDYTNAFSLGDNAVLGTTGAYTYSNWSIDAAGLITAVDVTTTDDVVVGDDLTVTGDLTVSGTSNFSTGTWTADNVVAETGNGSLGLDGDGSGGVVLQGTATGGITLTTDTTVTTDLTVNGGDFTMTSASASKPNLLFTNSVVGTTGSVTTYDHTRGGVASVDGDDIHTDTYNGYDDGPVADTFMTVLYEITDNAAGAEDGNITWTVITAGTDGNFLEFDGVDGFEINAGTIDIDVHVDGNDQADLIDVDAGNNDVTFTRNLASGGTNDGEIVDIVQSNAGADHGCLLVTNAANATAASPTVEIQSSNAAFDQPSLYVNHDCTAGSTTVPAVKIEAENTTSAALEVSSPSTAGGTDPQQDDTVVAFIGEGVGGVLYCSRAVVSATEPVVTIEDETATSTGAALLVKYAGNATADDVAVTFQATDAAYDEAVVAIINAGVGRGLFVDHNITTGDTLEPAFEVDSQSVDTAAALFRAPVDASGTDGDFDDYVVGISAEGVGGALHVHRAVDDPTGHLVFIEGDLANLSNSNANLLRVSTTADGEASDAMVEFIVTDAAFDQDVLVVTNGGTADNLLLDGVEPSMTIGDAGAEDTKIVFDGAAQDYYIALDDGTDDLYIGKGSAVGTTTALEIEENLVVTVKVALNVPYEVVTAANVITEFEGGKCFSLNNANAFASTLPDVASSAGMHLRFAIRTQPTTSHTIVTEGSENTISGGINELEVDTGDDGSYHAAGDTITFVANTAVAGDYVEMWCDGAFWYVNGQCNADGGITVTQASP